MAKDIQSKKRKASVPEVDAVKVKKTKKVVEETVPVVVKKRKATEDPAPKNIKKAKNPKPIAESAKQVAITGKALDDDDESAGCSASTKESKKSKSGKAKATTEAASEKSKTNGKSKTKNAAKSAEVEELKPVAEEENGIDSDSDGNSEIDDQTEALLKGFESEGDEDDDSNEGMPAGAPIPARKELTKKEEKKLKKIKESGASDKPGVIFIGRIPHGFYEHEMKEYFKQFGNILKIRLSRNKRTGASRHFAWIQFESSTVADIVARTMDNYLMFGHLLKVKLVPEEQVHPELFKGANKRFKKVPWNKLEGRKLEQGRSEEAWDQLATKEEGRRAEKAKKLKEIDYEFEAPKIKSAKGVAKKDITKEITQSSPEGVPSIESVPAVEGSAKPKKKKAKALNELTNAPDAPVDSGSKKLIEESVTALIEEVAEKPKKSKKSKSTVVTETIIEENSTNAEDSLEAKSKKDRKKTEVSVEASVSIPEKKLKTKESKTVLVESSTLPAEVEKVKKSKKAKKEKIHA